MGALINMKYVMLLSTARLLASCSKDLLIGCLRNISCAVCLRPFELYLQFLRSITTPTQPKGRDLYSHCPSTGPLPCMFFVSLLQHTWFK